ncbi:hypothetical protein MKEN_01367200 [Mycena kentingensis (nom. inval.)]|nr:hypothetical protein MKEN_01367200 [Mycena kentingensis (nom. inval.)]
MPSARSGSTTSVPTPKTCKSPATSSSPSSLASIGRLPLDVALEVNLSTLVPDSTSTDPSPPQVLKQCSLFDLAQLSLSSPDWKTFIDKNAFLWAVACQNFAVGSCAALPRRPDIQCEDGAGKYSDLAYALWMFGGGKCSSCGKFTKRHLVSYRLNWRSCSRDCTLAAKKKLLYWEKDIDASQVDASRPWADVPAHTIIQHENKSTREYSLKSFVAVRDDWERASAAAWGMKPLAEGAKSLGQLRAELSRRKSESLNLLQHSDAMHSWLAGYHTQRGTVYHLNLDFIRKVSISEKIRFKTMLRTPTLTAIFYAFNRDLEPLTDSVWKNIRKTIRSQVHAQAQIDKKADAAAFMKLA